MVEITNLNERHLVECKICDKRMKRLTNTHLAQHALSMEDYAQKFNIAKDELLWLPERMHHSKMMTGEGNSTYGMVRTDEWVKNITKSLIGKKRPLTSQRQLSMHAENRYPKSGRIKQGISISKKYRDDPTISQRQSKVMKERWNDPAYKKKNLYVMARSWGQRPNRPEKKVLIILNENCVGFQYTGDKKYWFHSDKHSYNPDFINKNKKLIIEVYGDYWHNLPSSVERDKGRLECYSNHGYDTLIIWEHELKDKLKVEQKIKQFVINKFIKEFIIK